MKAITDCRTSSAPHAPRTGPNSKTRCDARDPRCSTDVCDVDANPSAFKLIERFKPIDRDTIEWSVTINDPTTWTRPWTYAMNLARGGADKQPFEDACHEGNYGM